MGAAGVEADSGSGVAIGDVAANDRAVDGRVGLPREALPKDATDASPFVPGQFRDRRLDLHTDEDDGEFEFLRDELAAASPDLRRYGACFGAGDAR